jgi:hypothetical protein
MPEEHWTELEPVQLKKAPLRQYLLMATFDGKASADVK